MTCSFKDAARSVCGQGSIIPLLKCKNDSTEYLKKLGITERRGLGDSVITEQEIILNRSGFFGLTEHDIKGFTICHKHRLYLTVQWPGTKRKTCAYPTHNGKRAIQSSRPRRVTKTMSEELFLVFGDKVPLGSGEDGKSSIVGKTFETHDRNFISLFLVICDSCRKSHHELSPLIEFSDTRLKPKLSEEV